MSMEMHVFIQSSKIPSTEQWQQVLKDSDFDLTLDGALSIKHTSGYSLAIYRGIRTGFEFHTSPTSELVDAYSNVANYIGGRDLSTNFTWGGDLIECAAAVTAAAALSKIADGILFDPQEGLFFNGDEAIAMARQTVEELNKLTR